MDKEGLKNKIRNLISVYNNKQPEESLFRSLISGNADDLNLIINSKYQSQSVCGGNVALGELSFQCMTCAPDPHHMFCQSCFIPAKHERHFCYMRHDIGGCCDCGEDNTMAEEAFCPNHYGFKNIDVNQILAQIPQLLQERILVFVESLAELYIEKIDKLKLEYQNHDLVLLRFYQKCREMMFDELIQKMQLIEPQMTSFAHEVEQASKLHSILFRTITWLTKSKMDFTFLITKIFRIKLSQSNYSIFEELIIRQVHLEVCDSDTQKLDVLLFQCHADNVFKRFMQETLLLHYDKLWVDFQTTEGDIRIKEELCLLTNELHLIPDLKQALPRIVMMIFNYCDTKKNQAKVKLFVNRADFIEHHTQFVIQDLQALFVSSPEINRFWNVNKRIFSILLRSTSNSAIIVLTTINMISLRVEYHFFSTLMIQLLEKILSPQSYHQLCSAPVDKGYIEDFPFDNFFMTAYIRSFEMQPCPLPTLNQNLNDELLASLTYQLFMQRAVSAMKQATKKLVQDLRSSFPHRSSNLLNLMLICSYRSIKNYRNTIPFEQISDDEYQKHKGDQKEAFINLRHREFRSATVIDKFLTFLIATEYCRQLAMTPKLLREYLCNTLNTSIEDIKLQFRQILQRALKTYFCILDLQCNQLTAQYFGVDKNNTVSLESFDLTFMRFYIYLFGQEGYHTIVEMGKQLERDDPYDKLKIVSFKLLGSESDLYNVCGDQFDENLPPELQRSLSQSVTVVYSLQKYHTFSELKHHLRMIPIEVSDLEKHILGICKLDQDLKKLQLKEEFQPRYDPVLGLNSVHLNNLIIESRQKKDDQASWVGNAIDQDLELENPHGTTCLKRSILQTAVEVIDLQMGILQQGKEQLFFAQYCYLILKCLARFSKDKFEEIHKQVTHIIQKKYPDQQNQDFSAIIQLFSHNQQQNPVQAAGPLPGPQHKNNKANVKLMKEKYKQLSANFVNKQLQQEIQIEPNVAEPRESSSICQICKLSLNEGKHPCNLVYIQPYGNSTLYEVYHPTILQQLKQNNWDYTQLSLSTCRHMYHKECLYSALDADLKTKNYRSQLEAQLKLCCPVCKQCFNLTLPYNQAVSLASVEEATSWMLAIMSEFQFMKAYNERQLSSKQIVAEIIVSLFSSLLNQLFADPKEYHRSQKQLIFSSLLKISSLYFAEKQVKLQSLQYKNNLFLFIIHQIITLVINTQNLQLLKQVFKDQVYQYTLYLVHTDKELAMKILGESFDCQEVQLGKLESTQLIQAQFEPIKIIQNQLRLYLKESFQEFYFEYFKKGCYLCKFYPRVQVSEQYLCLLCLNVICLVECDLRQKQKGQYGNLSTHCLSKHDGSAIYISLQSGFILLMNAPFSIMKYKCLFYDNLGQSVDLMKSTKAKLSSYTLNDQSLQALAEILFFNQITTIIRSRFWSGRFIQNYDL